MANEGITASSSTPATTEFQTFNGSHTLKIDKGFFSGILSQDVEIDGVYGFSHQGIPFVRKGLDQVSILKLYYHESAHGTVARLMAFLPIDKQHAFIVLNSHPEIGEYICTECTNLYEFDRRERFFPEFTYCK